MLHRLSTRTPQAVCRAATAAAAVRALHASAAARAVVCSLNAPTRRPASDSAAAAFPTPRVATRMLIDGKFVEKSSDGASFPSVNPGNGRVIAGAEAVPQASAADVDAAVHAAHDAFYREGPGSWASLSPRARGALLYKLSELMSVTDRGVLERALSQAAHHWLAVITLMRRAVLSMLCIVLL